MQEEDYLPAFQLISLAGEAKSLAQNAITQARNADFSRTEELIKQAEKKLNEAHEFQSNLLFEEAKGNVQKLNIIMVHAQDHLSMAMMSIDNARELETVYMRIFNLEKKLQEQKIENSMKN